MAFTQGKLHLCYTCMGGQANSGGFYHVKHTYIHNLHKQKAYAYKLNSPSIRELDYYRILKELLECCGMGGCLFGLFCLLVLLGRYFYDEKSESFAKLTLSTVLVRLAHAALFMELELTMVSSGVLEQRIESQALLSY